METRLHTAYFFVVAVPLLVNWESGLHSVLAHSLTDLVVRPLPVSAAAAVDSLQVCTVL